MRVHNFGAGPCTLPTGVLEEAAEEMVDFAGTGMSVVELSHRSAVYDEVHEAALRLTRSVSRAPEDFEILFLQGGATLQFGMIPMNLAGPDVPVGFVSSGNWAKAAFVDAALVADAYLAWDGAPANHTGMPHPDEIVLRPNTRYLHICTNETIGGIRMVDFPQVDVPLVADMSSEYLARSIDWSLYDVVFGGVQKNLAPSGMAVVFIRKHLLAELPEGLPKYLRYGWHAKARSLANTPPMFSIYVMAKVLAHIEDSGGIEALERRSAHKAGLVYAAIDQSDGFYRNPVDERVRSHMNVVFRLPSEDLERQFVGEALEAGLVGLKGHRSVGGCRASLYAGLSEESAETLAAFMADFRSKVA